MSAVRRRPCCRPLYPMGMPAVWVQAMIVTSYSLAIISSWGCRFAEVDFQLMGHDTAFVPVTAGSLDEGIRSVNGLGLLSFDMRSPDGCISWSRKSSRLRYGTMWKAASASALTGNILIGMSMFLSFCLAWFHFSKIWRFGLAIMLLMGSLCEALTVVAFSDDLVCRGATCRFSTSAILVIAASVATFLSAIMVLDLEKRIIISTIGKRSCLEISSV